MPRKNRDPLKKLSIRICSEQNGDTRFPQSTAEDREAPDVCGYRNNQTALSQRYNYLFIAYSSEIRIYQPQFPSQKVPVNEVLAFELPSSGHGGRGYIDRRRPHAINHLIIGDVGNQETLLACCDDGDVVAISIHLIHKAVQRNLASAHGLKVPPAEDVRAFFIENVGASAWGLAMHKEARLLAVSSNTHDIHIFAFALGGALSEDSSYDPEEDSSDVEMEDLTENADWNELDGPPAPGQRESQNLLIFLQGHETNIPNICFFNSEADPDGKYLVSTDIDDRNYVWDIWKQDIVHEFSFTENINSQNDDFFTGSTHRRGWGVACLDPFTFRLTDGKSQTFGYPSQPVRRLSWGSEWDISASVDYVLDSSRHHPAMGGLSSLPGPPDVRPHAYQDLSQRYDDGDSEDDEFMFEDRGEEFWSPLASELSGVEPPSDNHIPLPGDWIDVIPSVFDTSSPSFKALNKIQTPLHNRRPEEMKQGTDLPFHILHTSEHDITMFLNEGYARVMCDSALSQRLPPRIRPLSTFERLSMIHLIPELGVVVIGSGAGRAALLTLTKMKHANPPLSGFRIDWILPFKSQEDQDIRPTMPLMGIAVSPIQGQGNSGEIADENGGAPEARCPSSRLETRRYRIMLIYAEHTVLSYEIGRSTTGTGYEVNDREILL